LEKVGISFKKEYLNQKVDNFRPKITRKKIFGPEWETESVHRIFTNMPFCPNGDLSRVPRNTPFWENRLNKSLTVNHCEIFQKLRIIYLIII
jgi:hypothetical protein